MIRNVDTHAQMERYVMNDGWWGEGSPTYHYYPLRAMLLSADAVRCRNINLYDRKLYKMLVAPASGVYADLKIRNCASIPAVADCIPSYSNL